MNDEPELPFDGPLPLVERPMVRRTDPCTSAGAAAVVRAELGKIQRLVLEVYRARGPMTARTAESLPEFHGYGFSTIRKRISELAHDGLLVSVGIDTTGRAPCLVYTVSERTQ